MHIPNRFNVVSVQICGSGFAVLRSALSGEPKSTAGIEQILSLHAMDRAARPNKRTRRSAESSQSSD